LPNYDHTEENNTAQSISWFNLLIERMSSREDRPPCAPQGITKPEIPHDRRYELVLARFFKNPGTFRTIQGRCNALVTGPAIRRLLVGHDTSDTHGLTLVVQKGHKGDLEDFLHSEDYQLEGGCQDQDVHTYGCHNKPIVTLVCWDAPPIHYILSFTFSPDMNFVTVSKIYSLWIEPIRYKEAYVFHSLTVETTISPSTEEQLRHEGFKIMYQNISRDKMAKLTKLRHVCDEQTLIVPLPAIKGLDTTVLDDVLEISSFQFRAGHLEHGGLIQRPLYVVRHPDLDHRYVVVEYFLARNKDLCGVFKAIMSVLRGSYVEKYKALPVEQRPSDWRAILVELECEAHSWMKFMDDRLYEALSQLQAEDTNVQRASTKREKKDNWLIEQLRQVGKKYTGHEPEDTPSAGIFGLSFS
jgi:hypothetical protein